MSLIDREETMNAFGLSEMTRKYEGDHSGYNTMMLYEIQDILEGMPTIGERKKGKWKSYEITYSKDEGVEIEEWQTAQCSVCGLWHTTPHMYFLNRYMFCPNCGADMRE